MYVPFLHRYVHVHCGNSTASSDTLFASKGRTCIRTPSFDTLTSHTRTRQVRWMHDIESVAVGAQQVTSSHPPSPAKRNIATHLPSPSPSLVRPFCARVWSTRQPGHTTLNVLLYKNNSSAPPPLSPCLVLIYYFHIDPRPDTLSHRQATVFF